MLSAGQIKEEQPEVKQEPRDYDEFAPNIFVKSEHLGEMPGSSTGRPAGTKTYSVKSTTAGHVPPMRVVKPEGTQEPAPKADSGIDPWYYKIPVYRRKEKANANYSRKYIQQQKLRIVKPRFIPNPGLRSQEELEKLMNELEEARKKDKSSTLEEYACPVPGCVALFTSVMGLNRHKALHREIYKCGECQQVFKEKEDLEGHIRLHEGVDPPSAIVTAQAIPRTMNLTQRKTPLEPLSPRRQEIVDKRNAILEEIALRQIFICGAGCKRSFVSKEELVQHMVDIHGRKKRGLVKPKEEVDK